MPFDSSVVRDLRVTPEPGAMEVVLRWRYDGESASPVFQVYQNGRLALDGVTGRTATLPWPEGPASYLVGEITPGDTGSGQYEDVEDELDDAQAGPKRARLSWWGGNYLDPDDAGIVGFRVYRSAEPGGPVDFTRPVATIPAYRDPESPEDGYGVGPYGLAYGSDASAYSWTSPPLDRGDWSFAVRAYDPAGNEIHAATGSATIVAPPRPPAPDARGRRLTVTFDPETRDATLTWLPSPDA